MLFQELKGNSAKRLLIHDLDVKIKDIYYAVLAKGVKHCNREYIGLVSRYKEEPKIHRNIIF